MVKVRVLSLAFFAVFAASAFAASSAQAGWLVLGSLLVGTAAIALATITHEKGVLSYPAAKITCAKLDIQKGEIQEPDLVLVGSLLFLECKAIEPPTCHLSAENEAGIGTLPLEALVTLDGSLAVKGKGKPKNANKVFATFKLEGGSCGPSGKQVVTGTATILAPEGQDERLWHLVNALIETTGELEVGNTPATITGSALVKLENDMPWSFD